MKVRVLVFSVLRDIVGAEEMEREVSEGATVGELVAGMKEEWPRLEDWEGRLLLAVNLEFAKPDVVLTEGAEVAVMPPVQGG
ncbi:MAG: MoaD/ThiS family protein [Verrucomicrobiota bacterium]